MTKLRNTGSMATNEPAIAQGIAQTAADAAKATVQAMAEAADENSSGVRS